MVTLFVAVAPGSAPEGLTRAFQRIESVKPGGMSRFHVRMVLPPVVLNPGVAAAHPPGVIVHPRHGSSNPYPGAHGSTCGGTVSQTSTFHQVFDAGFATKIE